MPTSFQPSFLDKGLAVLHERPRRRVAEEAEKPDFGNRKCRPSKHCSDDQIQTTAHALITAEDSKRAGGSWVRRWGRGFSRCFKQRNIESACAGAAGGSGIMRGGLGRSRVQDGFGVAGLYWSPAFSEVIRVCWRRVCKIVLADRDVEL